MPRSRWLLLFIGWTVFGVVQAFMRTALEPTSESALYNLIAFFLPLAWIWALLTPAIGWWTRVAQRRFPSISMRLAAHLPLVILTAVLHAWLRRFLIVAMGDVPAVSFEGTLLYFADLTAGSYLAAVWASHMMEANRRLVEHERQTQSLQQQLAAAQMEYLQLQLRPHFLFNALSTITELAHRAPTQAADMLRNVISLLEGAMAGHVRGVATLGEELDAVEPYLAIQRIRFPEWIVIEKNIPEEAREALVPEFILQPLVENAVHHGLIDRSEGGVIAIRAQRVGDRLRIEVTDNGVGLGASYHQSRGLGLANVRSRLEAVFGSAATFELTRQNGDGTAAIVEIPFRTRLDATSGPAAKDTAEPPAIATLSPEATNAIENSPTWRRRMWRRPSLVILAVWCIVTLLRIQHGYAYMSFMGRFTPEALRRVIRFDLTASALWLPLTALVLALSRMIPLRKDRLVLRVGAHMVAAFVIALTHTELTRVLANDYGFPLWSGPSAQVYAWNVSVYFILLIFAHFRAIEAWIRDRDIAAGRIRRELEEARFQKVILELRPQLLLDTLRHATSVVTANAKRAEKMLTDVSAFLRSTLEVVQRRDVPLRVEAAGVRAYARVLALVAAPDLVLRLSIPPSLMEQKVPNGVLRAALDAIVGDTDQEGIQVQLDLAAETTGIVVCANTSAPRDHPQLGGAHKALGRLDEYVGQGVVEPLENGGESVWFRIPRREASNAGSDLTSRPAIDRLAPSPRPS